ncbi:MAG: hypothetical protein ACTSPI_00445 [Candidatus Heimdallarchaeaceae archaeon]
MAKRKNEDVTFDENEVVEVTEEELTEGKEKKKREPSRRTILKNEIFEYVLDSTHEDALPDELMEKVKEFKSLPGRRTAGVRGPSIAGQLKEMILEEKQIHEDVFYDKFKLGRLEMKRRFYNMRKKVANPEDAVWVSFDKETGLYTLEGTGAEAPANWID